MLKEIGNMGLGAPKWAVLIAIAGVIVIATGLWTLLGALGETNAVICNQINGVAEEERKRSEVLFWVKKVLNMEQATVRNFYYFPGTYDVLPDWDALEIPAEYATAHIRAHIGTAVKDVLGIPTVHQARIGYGQRFIVDFLIREANGELYIHSAKIVCGEEKIINYWNS